MFTPCRNHLHALLYLQTATVACIGTYTVPPHNLILVATPGTRRSPQTFKHRVCNCHSTRPGYSVSRCGHHMHQLRTGWRTEFYRSVFPVLIQTCSPMELLPDTHQLQLLTPLVAAVVLLQTGACQQCGMPHWAPDCRAWLYRCR